MNILFLSLLDFHSLKERNIYTDFLRECVEDNHDVYVISPTEKRKQEKTKCYTNSRCRILKLKIGNIQKTGFIEKGISILTLENSFINAIKKYFPEVKFDLVIYTTPPITFAQAVEFVKKRDNAKSYLILRDIFPQNAVDMEAIQNNGIVYQFFRRKEKKLYYISDYIGCLSPANVEFIKKYNPDIPYKKLEIFPNSIEVLPMTGCRRKEEIVNIRRKFGIPEDRVVFVYGGNLGKPQGIEFIISCLKANKEREHVFFLIIGSGTEYPALKHFFLIEQPGNVKLLSALPKEEYEELVSCCDVGLIFLDYRFLIPNFPSRILSYMQAGLPVLAATDTSTDIGKAITEGGFGEWCPSNDTTAFSEKLKCFYGAEKRQEMGMRAYEYLQNHYSIKKNYSIIMRHFIKEIKKDGDYNV